MKSISEMSNEELLRAIDLCVDTGTSVTPRGFADDYAIASLRLAKAYRQELAKREQTQKRKDITLV